MVLAALCSICSCWRWTRRCGTYSLQEQGRRAEDDRDKALHTALRHKHEFRCSRQYNVERESGGRTLATNAWDSEGRQMEEKRINGITEVHAFLRHFRLDFHLGPAVQVQPLAHRPTTPIFSPGE
jgi:hypothetical protein